MRYLEERDGQSQKVPCILPVSGWLRQVMGENSRHTVSRSGLGKSHILVIFLAVTKLDKSNLKEGGFLLAFSSRIQSTMAGKVWC